LAPAPGGSSVAGRVLETHGVALPPWCASPDEVDERQQDDCSQE
jgi:hypothetical protein